MVVQLGPLQCSQTAVILELAVGTTSEQSFHTVHFAICSGKHQGRSAISVIGREDMADIVGVSVETVSRIVADLKRNRLLDKVGDNLYRCDRHALQSILHSRIDSD